MNKKIDPVGGQALIEGVMMRSKFNIGCAYRLPNGKIKTEKIINKPWIKKNKWMNIPFIRGVFVLIEILILGTKILIKSSQFQEEKEDEKIKPFEIFLTILFSIIFGIAIFKFFPLVLTTYFFNNRNSIIFNLIDGITRMFIFIIYLWIINFMSEVKILFQYHGAEHKAVNCYESGKKLTIENAMKSSRFHRRCGTAFVLYNFLISIVVFSFIPVSVGFWKLFLYRLPLLIPIAGISYEIIKSDSKILEPLKIPGLWLQRLTTKEPTKKQLEVSIKALETAL